MRILLSRLRPLFLLVGDITCFAGSLSITLLLRFGWGDFSRQLIVHRAPFAILFIAWLIIFYTLGLYGLSYRERRRAMFSRVFFALGINAVLAVIFFYFVPFFAITPKRVLFIDILITGALIILWRFLFQRIVLSTPIRLAVFGEGDEVRRLIQDIRTQSNSGYTVVIHEPQVQEHGIASLKEKRIDVVTVAGSWRNSPELQKKLFSCIQMHIQFYDFVDFYEHYFQCIPFAIIDRAWFLEHINEPAKEFFSAVKRICDCAGAFFIGVATLAVIALLSLLYAIEGVPMFYSQVRVGRYGKQFQIYKFRTLRREGDVTSVTKLGRILRVSHADELPQLWNILRGDMSFIGPRPEQTHFTSTFEGDIPFYAQRLLVRPGIMGWAQLHEPKATANDALSKLQYDLFYIKHRGFLLDAEILLKSLRHLLP